MIIKYKLTDQKLQTHGEFQWELGVWYEVESRPDQNLCTAAWLHCYDSPLLAVLHNPIHAHIVNPRLWEVECEGEMRNDNGMKCGYHRMRLVRELPVPHITIEQYVKYAILCAKQVHIDKQWNVWADSWLSNNNRTIKSAKQVEATTWSNASARYAARAAKAAAQTTTKATKVKEAEVVEVVASWAAKTAARATALRAVQIDVEIDAKIAMDTSASWAAMAARVYAEGAAEKEVKAAAASATAEAVEVKPLNLVELAEQAIK